MVRNSRSILSAMVTRSSARLRSSIPSSVRAMLKLRRRNSFFPSSSSSERMARERVGWVTCRSSAAWVMFSSRATARKYRRVRMSMVLPPYEIHKTYITIYSITICAMKSNGVG